MSVAELLSLFGGAGGGTALIFCILFISGWVVPRGTYDELKADRDEWKRTAELERTRADAAVDASQIVKDVMISLRKELG